MNDSSSSLEQCLWSINLFFSAIAFKKLGYESDKEVLTNGVSSYNFG